MDSLRNILLLVLSVSVPGVAAAMEIFRMDAEANPDGSGEVACFVDSEEGVSKIRLVVSGPDGAQVARVEAPAEFSVNWMKPETRKCEMSFSVRQPVLWTEETPVLYGARVELLGAGGGVLAARNGRFAFFSIEMRADDGLYLNGQKIRLRGINAPVSSWPEDPETRTAKCRSVVKDVRWLNANAIWCTNTVPDELVDMCDEAGLFVSGPGVSDVHGRHPCVVTWNRSDGVELVRSPAYGTLRGLAKKRQVAIAVPLLPQQGEGGLAAGLAECWARIRMAPRCAGGILEAREGWTAESLGVQGSAIREIWSPVSCSYADRTLTFSNWQRVLPLDTCSCTWQALAYPERGETVLAEGSTPCPSAGPGGLAQVKLPPMPSGTQSLRVVVCGRSGEAFCTWSFHIRAKAPVKWPQSGCVPPPGLEEAYFLAGARTNRFRNVRGRVMQSPELYMFSPENGGVEVTWGRMADGTYRMDYKLTCRERVELLGFAFPRIEDAVSTRWLGRGPERTWNNRLKGQQFGLWNAKASEGGFHADVEWFEIETARGTYRFTVVSGPDTFADCVPHSGGIEAYCRMPPFGPGLFVRIPGIGGDDFAANETGPSGGISSVNIIGHRAISGTVLVRWTPRP